MTGSEQDVEKIAQTLREEREERKLSQQDLADKLGVSQATVATWETESAEPRPTQLEAIRGWLEEDPETVNVDPCDVCGDVYIPLAMRNVAVRKDDEVHQSTLCHWCASSTTVREVTEIER